jgi:hypothetical protein
MTKKLMQEKAKYDNDLEQLFEKYAFDKYYNKTLTNNNKIINGGNINLLNDDIIYDKKIKKPSHFNDVIKNGTMTINNALDFFYKNKI